VFNLGTANVFNLRLAVLVLLSPAVVLASPPKEEPRYHFDIKAKTWKEVFVWLNEKTDLPVLGLAIPSNSGPLVFDFDDPTKAHTIEEIVAAINKRLLADPAGNERYSLIRRERDFALVPTEQHVDGGRSPIVSPDDLKRYAKSQLVRVVVPLEALDAENVRDEFAKLCGPFGRVDALKPNSLHILDTAGNVENIVDMIRRSEKAFVGPVRPMVVPQSAPALFRTYLLRGDNAEALVKELAQGEFKPSQFVRISADGANAIRVYGPPEVHEAIVIILMCYNR
jgi:hypothetical protein